MATGTGQITGELPQERRMQTVFYDKSPSSGSQLVLPNSPTLKSVAENLGAVEQNQHTNNFISAFEIPQGTTIISSTHAEVEFPVEVDTNVAANPAEATLIIRNAMHDLLWKSHDDETGKRFEGKIRMSQHPKITSELEVTVPETQTRYRLRTEYLANNPNLIKIKLLQINRGQDQLSDVNDVDVDVNAITLIEEELNINNSVSHDELEEIFKQTTAATSFFEMTSKYNLKVNNLGIGFSYNGKMLNTANMTLEQEKAALDGKEFVYEKLEDFLTASNQQYYFTEVSKEVAGLKAGNKVVFGLDTSDQYTNEELLKFLVVSMHRDSSTNTWNLLSRAKTGQGSSIKRGISHHISEKERYVANLPKFKAHNKGITFEVEAGEPIVYLLEGLAAKIQSVLDLHPNIHLIEPIEFDTGHSLQTALLDNRTAYFTSTDALRAVSRGEHLDPKARYRTVGGMFLGQRNQE